MLNTAILIYEGVELLDFAGPGEVFQVSKKEDKHSFNIYTVAPTLKPITCQEFLTLLPEFSIENVPQPDILLIPGGSTSNVIENQSLMNWIKSTADSAQVIFSVCTGAFILAEAGLLNHKKVTTWFKAIEKLRQKAPLSEVIENSRFVDNGKIITTAGVSAGIDGALHIVLKLIGKQAATEAARYIEFQGSFE